jgi:hypothetical protein
MGTSKYKITYTVMKVVYTLINKEVRRTYPQNTTQQDTKGKTGEVTRTKHGMEVFIKIIQRNVTTFVNLLTYFTTFYKPILNKENDVISCY